MPKYSVLEVKRMSEKNIHSGHRDRMKKKFLNHGLDVFETHEALELMLYYAVPYKDTNPLAHKLLREFGSLSTVFDAPFDRLKEAGLTDNQATYIKLIPQLARLYISDKEDNTDKIIDLDSIEKYIISKFIGRNEEHILLLLMDAKFKEVYCGMVSVGSISSTDIPIRKIVDLAMRYNARSAVIAHNHPSGFAKPSADDIESTINIGSALGLIGVYLLDHFIVADGDCVSLRQSNHHMNQGSE